MAQESTQTALLQELKQKTEPADKQTVSGEVDFAVYTRRMLEQIMLDLTELRLFMMERR